MANEGTVNVTLRINKTPLVETIAPGQDTFDVTNFGEASGIQNIGTSAEQITTTEVGTLGWGYFQNLDTTNYVTVGPYVSATYHPFAKLKPGEYMICRLNPGTVIYAQANTAAVELKFSIFDD